MTWFRLHEPPRKVKMGIGLLSDMSAKSRYYYDKSLERYRRNPEREKIHQMMERCFESGSMGRIDTFRLVESEN